MSDSSLYSQLTRSDEKSGTVVGIRAGQLATVSTGILATAFGSGVARVVDSVWATFVIGPLDGASSWIELIWGTITESMNAISRAAWAPLTEFVVAFGPVAWIAAVLAVLVIAYGVNRGRSLRE